MLRHLCLGAAAAAVLGCAGTTMAQFTANIGSAGPFAGTAGTQFNTSGINLNTINPDPIPAGEYVWYSISLNWDGSTATANQWSNEARVVLADVDSVPPASTTVPAPAVIYAGGNASNRGGVAAPNGQTNITARAIGWKGPMSVNYVTDGTGTAGLYVYVRQTFSSGTNPGVTWSNLTISLFESAPTPPANDLCSGATDISAAANAGLTTPGVPWVSPKYDMVNANPLVEDPEPTGFTCVTSARKMIWLTFTPAVSGAYQLSTCLGGAIANTGDHARSAFAVYTTVDGLCPPTASGLTLVAGSCATLNCAPIGLPGTQATTQSGSGNIFLNAGTTYFILIGRPLQSTQPITNIIGAQEESYQLAITRVPPPPACTITAPPITSATYNNKASASVDNAVTIAAGDTLCGTTTGSSTTGTMALTSANYWRLKTLAAADSSVITRYQLAYATLTSGHTVTIRGLTQTAGVPNAGTDTVVQTMATSGTPGPINTLRWYTHGSVDRELFVAVTGTTGTTQPYHLTVSKADVTPVDAGSFVDGPITITAVGQGHSTDTEIWVYDSNGDAIPGWGNDDTIGPPTSLQSTLTRTFTPGTYYIAVGGFNMANNLGSPPDDNFRSGAVVDFEGVTASSRLPTPLPENRTIRIIDSVNAPGVAVSLSATERFEVLWVKIQVNTPGPTQCNPADIAATDASPGPDGCVDNGDFSLFISSFFGADCTATCGVLPLAQCNEADIAATDASVGFDGCVDNGDFSLFISSFFGADCSATCNP
jgi:hypothetical protein